MPAPKVQWRSKTSWRAKPHEPTLPKLGPVPDGMAKRLGYGISLIPTAPEVDAMIRKNPRGEVSTLAQIRKRLARRHNVDMSPRDRYFPAYCRRAAREDPLAGKSQITPHWRVMHEGSRMNAKFPQG